MTKPLPSPELLRKLLRYEPYTGKLFWRERSIELFHGNTRAFKMWNTRYAGKEAFTYTHKTGYKVGSIFNRSLRAHRVIWAIYYGKWPENEVEHKNGVEDDNRIKNLSDVTHAENMRNLKKPANNTSGTAGVDWHVRAQKWRVRIKVNKKEQHLGLFDNKDDAIAARLAAEKEYGYHPNHGR